MGSDRDGNIWIGTAQGLLRVNPQGAVTPLDNTESIGTVSSIFEDREGNLWAGGTSGIRRLRDATFSTFSVKEGLPSNSNGAIYADSFGRIWFAPIEGGLFWIQDGKVSQVTADGLNKDIVYSIIGANGELWVGRQRGGLTHLTYDQKHIAAHTYTHRDGLAQDSVYTVHRSRDGAIWAGTLSGGVTVLRDGRFTHLLRRQRASLRHRQLRRRQSRWHRLVRNHLRPDRLLRRPLEDLRDPGRPAFRRDQRPPRRSFEYPMDRHG